MTAKKDNPEYKKVCGHVPNTVLIKFKKLCLDKNLDLSTALEIAIIDWIEKDNSQENQ